MAKDPYRYFRIEASELAGQLTKGVLDLEKGDSDVELVLRLLRLAHTLKGAARVVRQAEIADLAHRLEDTLAPYRDGAQHIARGPIDQALATLDAINAGILRLPAPDQPEAAPAAATAAPPVVQRVLRTDLVEVEAMLEGLGEIGNELGGLRRQFDTLARVRNLAGQLVQYKALPTAKLNLLGDQLQSLLSGLDEAVVFGMLRIERELREVREAAERLRLVPIAGIFNTLERTARDAAHSTGKQVVFEASGGELRIDAMILDSVQSALIQLVRNAVAHGIEAPDQRSARGKSTGRIAVQVERRGYRAWFRCSDDGAGIDLDALRQALRKKGVAATEDLDVAALMRLLLEGGISTSTTVTEIAGRGIGLNLVREVLQQLGGEIFASSNPGKGTMIELVVPLSLAALDVLLIEHDGHNAALPLDAVRRTLRVTPHDIVRSAQGQSILYEGAQIPFAPLHLGALSRSASSLRPVRAMTAQTAVVLAGTGGTAAIAVDRPCGMDTVVLRSLPSNCPADPLLLGAYLDGEGNPRMVLDPDVLAMQAWSSASQAPVDVRDMVSLPILIIDDSLTTRMLESSILESAGYTVEMAVCAEDGWEMAQRARYALFLVDVEMPGMDGFTFVGRTRSDPVLREIPCILVSSRDAPEDRQRGLDSGAHAYIVKGEFDQGHFLQLVSGLVQR